MTNKDKLKELIKLAGGKLKFTESAIREGGELLSKAVSRGRKPIVKSIVKSPEAIQKAKQVGEAAKKVEKAKSWKRRRNLAIGGTAIGLPFYGGYKILNQATRPQNSGMNYSGQGITQ